MKITKIRKKLIEISIPLEAINRESAREKSIRHGHPSTLHLWWARRPLAACRAVLFAQFVDDPSSCPEEYPTKAMQDAERERLHKIIEAIVPWEATRREDLLNAARYEIARSVARGRGETLPPLPEMRPQQIIDYLQEYAPPVYDPFSGGGSIPLEAQRLGLKAMGSDLNPVAVLIGKALIEFPPKFAGRKPVNPEVNELHQWKGAQGLADDVRYYGRWMRAEAEKKIEHHYPKVKLKDGKTEATVIAWLWARTVASPDPRAKGAHVPLASSFVLSAKEQQEAIVRPIVDREKLVWSFEVDDSPSKEDLETAKNGTKSARGANFTCLLTGAAINDDHIKTEAMAGRLGVSLMAIVAEGNRSRTYIAPNETHITASAVDAPEVPEVDQALPHDPRAIWCTLYGLDRFTKLFTSRQLFALATFADLVMKTREKVLVDAQKHWSSEHEDDDRRLAEEGLGPTAYADAVATYLGFAIDKVTEGCNSLCTWSPLPTKLHVVSTFGRQALPFVWDFAEANPFANSSGNLERMATLIAKVLDTAVPAGPIQGEVNLGNSIECKIDKAAISTDPPYYDNIGYADLSDFFYVWLRRTLSTVHPALFRRIVTSKNEELVASPYRHGGRDEAEAFFLSGMKEVLGRIAQASADVPAAIFYAFKQTETSDGGITSPGWSTFLQAVVDSGQAVDGTWPIRTERAGGFRNKEANALASSIVLVCRRREPSARTIVAREFLTLLRREMPAALFEIKRAGVGPTDIQQAAIGPGIGVFTRHAQVLNTDGTPMLVKDALKLINQVREEITSHGDADYDSETRFALDWFAAKGFDKGKSGDAITMCNAVNVSLDGIKNAGFFDAKGGDARLLKREELPDDYDPAKDSTPTVWEACQHLIKRLTAETGGIDAAAALYNRLGSRAEPAHALARRLYDICEQKQWATEGRVYNQLHLEWDTIERRAADQAHAGGKRDLFA